MLLEAEDFSERIEDEFQDTQEFCARLIYHLSDWYAKELGIREPYVYWETLLSTYLSIYLGMIKVTIPEYSADIVKQDVESLNPCAYTDDLCQLAISGKYSSIINSEHALKVTFTSTKKTFLPSDFLRRVIFGFNKKG